MKIEFLKWDSDFFGIKIGKLLIDEGNQFDPILFNKQAAEENYELIYVFKFHKMLEWVQVIDANLELVDIQLTMSKKFKKNDFINESYDLKTNLTDLEKAECYLIADSISLVSRFCNEKIIGKEKTKKLYRKWIDNALNNSFSDGIFLVKEQGKIVGIHIIKTNNKEKIGHCSIIGVDSNFKGKNIGTKLWNEAYGYWANQSEIEFCRVPFSIQNTESFNFHMKMGFNKIEETKFIYHFKNNNQ